MSWPLTLLSILAVAVLAAAIGLEILAASLPTDNPESNE